MFELSSLDGLALAKVDYGKWPTPFDAGGVQYVFDSVSLGLLKTCPRKYQLAMVLNWQTKSRSHHLEFGILYHSAIEGYLKLMAQWDTATNVTREDWHEDCVRQVIRQTLIDSVNYKPGIDRKTGQPKTDKTRFNLIRSLVWYFENYGLNDPCKPVLLHSGKPAVELSFRFDIGQELMLAGHLDQIVSFGDDIYVLDHKTTSSTVTGRSKQYYFSNFKPDNQMSLYALGASVVFGTPVRGVLIDAAQIAVGFTAFGRDMTHRSEPELQEFLHGVYAYRRQVEAYTKAGFFPMNETACGNYGGCEFREVCSKSPLVRDRFLRTDFTQDKPWNPLESR